MKAVVLIFSIIVAIVSLLISLVAYPFIASLCDFNPGGIAGIFGGIIFIIVIIVTLIITKNKFFRSSIILPCLICVVGSIAINGVRFADEDYSNGFINRYGDLYDNLGFRVISNSDGIYYLAVDSYGNDVIVYVDYDKEWKSDEYLYEYKIRFYASDYSFIAEDSYRKWSEDNDAPYTWDIKDVSSLIEYHTDYSGVSVYERIG